MVRPSIGDHRVEGAFNAGVSMMGDQVIMLLRVAESIVSADPAEILVPTLERQRDRWGVTRKAFRRDDPAYDFSDPREIKLRTDPSQVFLTSMSHIRVARSTDGIHFAVDDGPFLFPETRYERFGCEDPRITWIDGRYFINYTAVSDLGIGTALAATSDFVAVERLGLIFAPDNRDVCLFPAKIDGFYWALHRPAPLHFGAPEIWIARSPDLIHWGDHRILAERIGHDWESRKIGGGAQMLATPKGWLQIYHGVDASHRYSLGALLLDLTDPSIVRGTAGSPARRTYRKL